MLYTKESISNTIKRANQSIENLKEQIQDKKQEIKDLEKLLKELEKYESQPIEKLTYYTRFYKDTGTVYEMDKFESLTEEGFRKYKRMLIGPYTIRSVDSEGYSTSQSFYLIVERLNRRETTGNITATELKQGYTNGLFNYIRGQLETHESEDDIIIFDMPYWFRAQNSKNRQGYGSEYNGYDLVWQGTLYGETTNYCISGIELK